MHTKNVLFADLGKWNFEKQNNLLVYYAGCKKTVKEFLIDNDFSNKKIKKKLSQSNNFFSAIIESKDKIICISDFCRSFPIFYYKDKDLFIASNDARILQKTLKLNKILDESVNECFFSGYVSGKRTLYKSLYQTEVCKFLKFNKHTNKLESNNYFFYHKKIKSNIDGNEALVKLDKVIDSSINRLIKKTNNRTIVIFMSGGLDSRLILSKLVEKGYRKILAFSYGIKGNSDSKIAKEICEKLKVKWQHLTLKKVDYSNFFKKQQVVNFIKFADGLASVPHFHDFLIVQKLKKLLVKSKNYLIVNGQTGDFISGGHIPYSINLKQQSNKILVKEIFSKHYSLWKEPSVIKKDMIKGLEKKIDELKSLKEYKNCKQEDIYEIWEYHERQVKFILQGQRVYDYFGFDWYLPFWDGAFVRFWSEIPTELRINQFLYKKYLKNWNFAGLFKDFNPSIKDFDSFPYNLITPFLIFLKIILGKKKRNSIAAYFDYFSRYGHHYHIFGLIEFINERKKIRNSISLYVKKWFEYLDIDQKVSLK